MTTALLPAHPTGAEIKAAPSLAAAVRDLDARRARSRQKKIGASEIGECRRRAAYVIAKTPKTNTPTGLQAALGTAIHKEFLRAMRRMYGGITEVRVENPAIKGSCDWLDEFTVEDLKTTSKGGYEKVQTRGPYVKHWYQVTTYAWLMRMGYVRDRRLLAVGTDTIDVEAVRLRYLSRDSGADTVYEKAYDPFLAAEAMAWLADVYGALEDDPNPESVPRDGYGPGIDSFCDYCPFLDACWGPPIDPEHEADLSRQSQLTVTDEDFIQAVADYAAWRTAEGEAKREKEFARERLRGRSGQAGEFYCAWQGGNETTTVDKEAALDILRERGIPIPTKTGRSPRAINVKKVTRE